jgi:hypothetical protein
MGCIYLINMRFQQTFRWNYPCKQSHHIGPTWCKWQVQWDPMRFAVICWRIHLVKNIQVVCYTLHYGLKLAVYSSRLPTAFRYHLAQYLPHLSTINFLFTATIADDGSITTWARYMRIRIQQNDRRFMQYTTPWDTTTMQTPLSPLRPCDCTKLKFDHWRAATNDPSTASNENRNQNMIGFRYILISVDRHWLTI